MARWASSLARANHPRPGPQSSAEYSQIPREDDANQIELHIKNSNAPRSESPVSPLEATVLNDSTFRDNDSDISDLTETGLYPTDHKLAKLRKVSDTLPWSAFLIALVELCERFAYYGLSGVLQNYMQHSYDDSAVPGALGLGQKGASRLSNLFQFWCYVTPIGGAIMADQFLGRYQAILYSSIIYISGIMVLFLTSLPRSIELGLALPGLIIAMIIIGLGSGGIKSNVSPLIAEQYQSTKPYTKILRSGERVIVDPSATIQRIYMIFYLCINIGSLSSIATTELELHIGFWSAFLLPLCMFIVSLVVVVAGRRSYVSRPPKGSVIPQAFKAIWIAITHNFSMDAAKPSLEARRGITNRFPWDDQFVEELKRALVACRVFAFYPIYWVAYGQMINNFISQAAQMELHGIPNDILQNIDPITIVIFIPVCDRFLYPFLRKHGILFRPITRIAWGFGLVALSMAYAAFVQHLIYQAGPCFQYPLECDASQNGSIPNHVHVAVQAPAYLLVALSEIFASVTGLEYAYTKAPETMKSFIMSLFLLQNAFGAALGIALSSTAENPKLVWMYTGLSAATFGAAVLFWLLFRSLNAAEDSLNALSGDNIILTTYADVADNDHQS